MTTRPASNKARVPLSRYHVLTTSDLDKVRAVVKSYYHSTQCDVPKNSNFKLYYNYVPLKGISVGYHSISDQLFFHSGPTLHSYIVHFYALKGRSRITYGKDTTIVTEKHGGSVMSTRKDCMAEYERGQRQIIIRIERAVLERVFQSITGRIVTEPLEFEQKMDTNDVKIANLQYTCRQIIQGLDGRDDFAHIPNIHAQVIDFIISGLLYAQPHNYSEMLLAPTPDAGPHYLKQVEEYITAHSDQPLRITDIAQLFNVSVRALQAGFKKHRGYTMSQFIKQVRLERAHYLLQYEPFRSVQEVAFACSYNYAGQFAAEYKQKFGELPNKTRKRFL